MHLRHASFAGSPVSRHHTDDAGATPSPNRWKRSRGWTRWATIRLRSPQGANKASLAWGRLMKRPIQRMWRDLEVASRHQTLGYDLGRKICARSMLGVGDPVTAIF